jgi:hypothetical protein
MPAAMCGHRWFARERFHKRTDTKKFIVGSKRIAISCNQSARRSSADREEAIASFRVIALISDVAPLDFSARQSVAMGLVVSRHTKYSREH